MRKAFDVSNFWFPGPVGDDVATDALASAKALGYTRIIAGTQVPSVCWQQLSIAYTLGFALEAYVQFSADKDVTQQFSDARNAVDTLPIRILWIAAEWPDNPAGYASLYKEAHAAARAHGFVKRGVYTNWDNWNRLMANTVEYRSLPLWYANYDNVPYYDAPLWRVQGFGGWWKPAMKQHTANVPLGNLQNVDLNAY